MKTNGEEPIKEWSINPNKVWSGGTEGYEINHGNDGEVVAEFVYTLEDAVIITNAPKVLQALKDLTERYRQLVESGDCGFWKPEDEPEFAAALTALNNQEK